ncbi:MAG: Clp protease N-terminal domain-containing protein [Thermomicrobiales bacterium]
MAEKFEKFTDRGRAVFPLAEEEARRFDHDYIGTEHILLGLIREREGVAGRVLADCGLSLPPVRSAVASIVGFGTSATVRPLHLTPRAKEAMALAMREARHLKHDYIGTEHLLLGLVREEEGVAARILASLGVSGERVREQVLAAIGEACPTRSPLPEFVWQRVKRGVGRPPLHGTRMHSLRVNIPDDLSGALSVSARHRQVSQSEIVRLALEKWLREEPPVA